MPLNMESSAMETSIENKRALTVLDVSNEVIRETILKTKMKLTSTAEMTN